MTNGRYIVRAIYFSQPSDEFIVRVAHDVKEACDFVETGFEHVTVTTSMVAKYSESGNKKGRVSLESLGFL